MCVVHSYTLFNFSARENTYLLITLCNYERIDGILGSRTVRTNKPVHISQTTTGRAGRAGIDSIGEAYIYVTKGLLDRAIKLITAKLSPVVSQVKDITKVALQAVASGLATKRNHVCLMMSNLLLFSSASPNEKQSLMQAILREVK